MLILHVDPILNLCDLLNHLKCSNWIKLRPTAVAAGPTAATALRMCAAHPPPFPIPLI